MQLVKRTIAFVSLMAVAAILRPCSGLAYDWHPEKGFRWADLNVPKTGKTGFTLVTPAQSGLTFSNRLVEWNGAANRVLYNGSGLAVGDYDGDGLQDLFFCGLDSPCALFKNLGNWKFKEVTQEAGVNCPGNYFRGATFADVNGDGALDLLVATTGRGVWCFQNDGHGKFNNVTATAGTTNTFGNVGMALADIDGNGTLDLYVVVNRTDDIRDRGQVDVHMVKGQLRIPPWLQDRLVVRDGKVDEMGEPDQLLLNDGKGHFTPVSWTEGRFLDEEGHTLVQRPLDWGLTAVFFDMNGDGAPDVYVCNDYWSPDRIWINDGKGNFRALPTLAVRKSSASSMGMDFTDLDRDGNVDFFALDMLSRSPQLRKRQVLAQLPMPSPIGMIEDRPQVMRNTLFLNRGDTTFAEIACYAGVAASDWAWSPAFVDVDLDGYEDLLIVTGHVKDVQDLDAGRQIDARQRSYAGYTDPVERQRAFIHDKMLNTRLYPELLMPIVAFRNRGDLTFEEVTPKWGTEQLGCHHGIAFGDFDDDGDLDFAVNNLGEAAGLYRNDGDAPRVAVILKGASPNTEGIGAKIKLLGGAVPMQSREVVSGGRYMAGSQPLTTFAPGKARGGMTLEVTWRNGKVSRVSDLKPNRIYEIEESSSASSAPPAPPASPAAATVFRDVSLILDHLHRETPFNDFERQPLLPFKLSQLGPGVAWFDLDGDGREELILGSGRGGALAVYRPDGKGRFTRVQSASRISFSDDLTGLAGWSQGLGKATLLVAVAGYEVSASTSVLAIESAGEELKSAELLPAAPASTGPLAVADMDGDGYLDLFVGGRALPGRWPEPAPSRLFRYDGKQLVADPASTQVLASAGMVSGAVWSDLDGDGFPELILACEWGPVRVFRNQKGVLREATAELGLDQYTGWWRGVTTGDFDGDGRLDILAANWGRNSSYQASPALPVKTWYGDLADRGVVDIVETEYDPATHALTPMRAMAALYIGAPFLVERFPTYKAYSEASILDFLGDRKSRAHEIQANTLASTLFLNRSNRFEAVELPPEAQFAPASSVNVGDFDGDGHEDVFLSQNFFDTRREVPRFDGGRGLWLRGDGSGKLTPVPGQVSGVRVYGEQRGAALGDFNEDGRIDLVVSQNGAMTRLFQNEGARPGLRVRLSGSPGNPSGIGAAMRLIFGERSGPVRELHGGSGYWSQDSLVQVMATPQTPTRIWVRWPGGKSTTADIPAGAREITVAIDGTLKSK